MGIFIEKPKEEEDIEKMATRFFFDENQELPDTCIIHANNPEAVGNLIELELESKDLKRIQFQLKLNKKDYYIV